MDFSDLTNWFKGKLAGMQSFRGQDGVMYGPAQDRRTRLPVMYHDTVGEGTAGFYSPGIDIHNLGADPRGIHVFPNSRLVRNDGSTSPTIEHEEVHALQDQVGQLNKGNIVPGYQDVAHAIAPNVGGYLPAEAPADAISYDPRFTPALDPDKAHAYAQGVIAQTPAPQAKMLQQIEDSAKSRLASQDAALAQRAK